MVFVKEDGIGMVCIFEGVFDKVLDYDIVFYCEYLVEFEVILLLSVMVYMLDIDYCYLWVDLFKF